MTTHGSDTPTHGTETNVNVDWGHWNGHFTRSYHGNNDDESAFPTLSITQGTRSNSSDRDYEAPNQDGRENDEISCFRDSDESKMDCEDEDDVIGDDDDDDGRQTMNVENSYHAMGDCDGDNDDDDSGRGNGGGIADREHDTPNMMGYESENMSPSDRNKNNQCSFMINAHKHGNMWVVTTANIRHTCARVDLIRNQHSASMRVENIVPYVLSADATLSSSQLARRAQEFINTPLSRSQGYRLHAAVLIAHEGKDGDSFTRLRSWACAMRTSDSSTHVIIETEKDSGGNEHYVRMFVCLGFVRRSYAYLRPVFMADGAHCSSRSRGVLFTVTGIDGDNHIVTLAYGHACEEGYYNWRFMFQQTSQCLPGIESWRAITDRNPGLLRALYESFPNADHSVCCRHLLQNAIVHERRNKNAAQRLFWHAANAVTTTDFNNAISEMKTSYPRMEEYLRNVKEKWATIHVLAPSFHRVTSQAVEASNARNLRHRHVDVLYMMDGIAINECKVFAQRHKAYTSQHQSGNVPNAVRAVLEKAREKIGSHNVIVLGDRCGSVARISSRHSYAVDLDHRTCGCALFDVLGIPCQHAVSLCKTLQLDPDNFVHPSLTLRRTTNTYITAQPLRHPSTVDLNEDDLQSPEREVIIGRRKTKRFRGPDEGSESKSKKPRRCSSCGNPGHNAKTCGHRESSV